MVRTVFALFAVLAFSGCDSPTPVAPEAVTFRKCVAKNPNLSLEQFLVFGTADQIFILCHDRLGGEFVSKGMSLAVALAPYTVDLAAESECAKARRAIIDPIQERIVQAYKKDGEDAFCAWVGRMHDEQNSALWTRFWQ
jgi:hypothetical protein